MIKILKNFFDNSNEVDRSETNDNLSILSGLMIEAANIDGKVDSKEIEKIKTILKNEFNEEVDDIDNAMKVAIENKHNSKSLFYYTSKINKSYSTSEKIFLIETLWQIILADGEVHDYETSLLRRLSGLLYISDVDSGNARKRALTKINDKL